MSSLSPIEEAAARANEAGFLRLDQLEQDIPVVAAAANRAAVDRNAAVDRAAANPAVVHTDQAFNQETFIGIGADRVAMAAGGVNAHDARADASPRHEPTVDELLRVRAEAFRRT